MRYQVELSHVKWKKCMQMQMAMHCAPVLAGLKPSNAVTLDYIDSKELIQSLAGSDIKCGLIYSGNGKCLWLLYREQQVNQYLMDPENQRFLKHCGYSSFQIQNILYTLKNRYRLYKAGQADFPHELGLILGYPLCDVIGFIKIMDKIVYIAAIGRFTTIFLRRKRFLKFMIKFVSRWSNLWNTERVLKNSSTCTQIIRYLGMLN